MATNTLQFEAVKIAMKQDKTGIILTLNIHPDELPIDLMRDFVGARYQVVMVRLSDENAPLVRDAEYSRNPVRTAGILCRDKQFAQYLFKKAEIEEESEADVIQWLKGELGINSRTELNEDQQKAKKFWAIYKEYRQWNPPA
tara:strand:+ start:3229 stop:3654 length:426 start_codon:yes stop_codon:yes gene_type:complete